MSGGTGPREHAEVVVVGGGVIGLTVAWRLAQRGRSTVVVDDPARAAAARVAAGMLTPVTEAWWGEDDLLELAAASMRRWPSFAEELGGARRLSLDLDGVLAVGADTADAAVIADLHTLHERLGVGSEALTARSCRELEPLLASSVRGGLLAAGDGAVDPRRLLAALEGAARVAGARLVMGHVEALATEGGRSVGVHLEGELVRADDVVLAAGAWSRLLDGLPAEARPPVRPVFGEVLRLRQRTPELVPRRVLRAVVQGRHLYVVPRSAEREGAREIVVGATSLERGYDTTVTAGGVHELLRDATALVPALAEAHLAEVAAGLRPGTPDNAPILGPAPLPGLYLATGHYRNGVLLAPLTGDVVAAELCGERVELDLEPCRPTRFAAEPATRGDREELR